MLNSIFHIFPILIIISLLSNINSQNIHEIKIGEVVKGKLNLDEGHSYYQLKIPRNESNRILIISTSEDSSLTENIKDSFSDPDFYVSKINKYPSSKRSAEWYSEQYGSDILTIPAESVEEDDIFYIGIYCQFKCKYFLKVETGFETEINMKEYNYLRLNPKETMNYKLKIDKGFEVLKVMAISEMGGKFKIFMNQRAPSSLNTYKVVPSWENGYSIIIKKNSLEYCTNCEYHIVIHNEENNADGEVNNIILYTIAEDKDQKTNLEPFQKIYDVMEDDSKSCFDFNITAQQKRNEKLIIDLVIYSGYATLLIEGWRSKYINTRYEADKSSYSHNVNLQKYIILDKKDFDAFDQEQNYYSGRDSTLNFCVYSTNHISYTIKTYFLNDLEKDDESNILLQGNKLRGYLLKDQVIGYELFGDNFKLKNKVETNITLTINKVVGSISSFGYFCKEEECKIKTKQNVEALEGRNKLLLPKKEMNPFISTLQIAYNDNECMKNPEITLDNGNKITCVTYAIIKCDKPSEETGLCIYDIQYTTKDTEIIMKQRQIYNGMVYSGKNDRYKITISDNNIENLFIVLNSETGDAQLSVYLEDETSYNKESLISISSHNDYIPDVVRITPKKIGKDNLVGKYIVKVYPETFSTYQLYYYVTYKKGSVPYYLGKKDNIPEVSMNLDLGFLILDYFPIDIRYKVYSFTPMETRNENIKIFLNRVNINFDIYVFTDIFKFEIEQLYDIKKDPNKEVIKGYKYKSNSNNEIIIPKTDTSFNFNKNIYIVVAPSNPLILKDSLNDLNKEEDSKDDLSEKAISKYYIGVISQITPLSLSEGMPHVMTLSNSYSSQIYYRYHTNFKNDFEIILNVLMGEVDIFISPEYITEEEIEKIDYEKAKYDSNTDTYEYKKIRYQLNVNSLSSIEVDREFMLSNLQNENERENIDGVYVYYYISRSDAMEKEGKVCQYVVIEKTSETKGQILQPGVVTMGELQVGEREYFIVEEIEKRKWAFINVIFKKGTGNVYLRIPQTPESHSNIRFPDEGNYDYKGNLVYSGRIIRIPEKEFGRLNSENKKLQLLITITADAGTETVVTSSDEKNKEKQEVISEIEYTISYSNEPKRINQNEPYDGYITQGEFQYFNLYFDKNTKNIYIGLFNMNGDADMYLSKGKKLPTTNEFDWSSTDNAHEYIDISKDDMYFQTNKQNISGYYSLLIVGFVETSYSLFVSSHDKKVLPLRNNLPMTCWCAKEGDKCLFRYNDVWNKNNGENGLAHNEIIFTTQYLYGSGYMYSKVYVDSELHNSNDFYKSFPDSNNFDYSNKISNQRNYMKVKVDGEKYTPDSSILLTFECSQKTKVDITSTPLYHFSSVEYIGENRENTFYLGKNDFNDKLSKLTLVFNNNNGKDQDLIYSVHSYIGDAHFKVYGNVSNWDVKAQKIVYDYKLLNEFDLITNDKNQDFNIDVYNPYTHDYHNFIPKIDKEKYDDIYFYVEPKTEFGFYIQCTFDKNWNKLQIGKSQSFFVVNNQLFGYFDINEEYDNVEFSLSVDDNLKVFAEVYIKINIIDKNEITQIKKSSQKRNDEFSLYHYSIPSEENYDYKSITDVTLGKLSLNLNKLPKLTEKEIEKGNKIIRGLFYVKLGKLDFQPIQQESNPENPESNNNDNDDNSNENNNVDQNQIHSRVSLTDIQTTVHIVITPGMHNFKYMQLKPYEYYFSNLTYNTSSILKPVETKVYDLTRENPDHDIMVIEISTCEGWYEFNIQEELITKDNLGKKPVKFTERNEKGKKIIYIEKLKYKHYYLSIIARKLSFICQWQKIDLQKCGTNLQYLIYYYTTFSENLSFENVDKWIVHKPYGRGRVRLELPIAISKDLNQSKKAITDYRFDVFATKNQDDTSRMMNICYLSKLVPSKESIFKVDSITSEKNNALILSNLEPGNRYYISVLAQNTKTKEILTFHPIEIYSGGRRHGYWYRLFRNIILFALIIFLGIYIYKYRQAREELIFLKGEAVAKTTREMSGMSSMNYDSQGIKYSTLGSGY